MKNKLKALLLVCALIGGSAFAAETVPYEKVRLDLGDQASLQRGAQVFVNYCLTCHSASVMRYNRLTDLGLTEEDIVKNLMFTTDKVGDTMISTMSKEDAKLWFGNAPPDLSTIARSRGADYLYAYLKGFYQDTSRPLGWNNTVLPNAAMPHVLWELQGVHELVVDAKGQPVLEEKNGVLQAKFAVTTTGFKTEAEYDATARDLVNYMVYMGEPAQVKRHQIGYAVLLFLLLVMLPLSYFLNREYWKDIH